MELLYASSSRCRDTNLGVFSPPRRFAPLVFFFLPRICLSFWSLFFVYFLLSLYFFFFLSPSFFSLCSPQFFFFPFIFLLFSSSRWYCLSLSKPLFPVNISSFSVIFVSGRSLFSLLYSFPCFFFFSPPSLCFRSFFSPPLSLQIFPPRAALVPRIYRQEERAATLSLPNPRDRVGWLRRLCGVVSAARRVWLPCPIFIMVAGEGRGLCQDLCKWGGR